MTPQNWDELADAVLTHDAELQEIAWPAVTPRRKRRGSLRHVLAVISDTFGVLLDSLARRVPDVEPIVFDRADHERWNDAAERATVVYGPSHPCYDARRTETLAEIERLAGDAAASGDLRIDAA